MTIKEIDIQKQIIQYLQYLENQDKLFFSRVNTTGIYDSKTKAHRKLPVGVKRGFADILVIIKGQAIFLEVKRKGSYQSEFQKTFQQSVEINKACYFVVRSIEEVKAVVEARVDA